jgi:hypothetical protein
MMQNSLLNVAKFARRCVLFAKIVDRNEGKDQPTRRSYSRLTRNLTQDFGGGVEKVKNGQAEPRLRCAAVSWGNAKLTGDL